ncbi:AraC family transcriptional regulator [Dictyobacter alpinus]|uniref:AraC family transcriptional regulator n=1 Tax=Dictyobacter alpinus TaxID=2014873 RepID=A0A402BGQ4_9CHLR|nr:AraC family transcriptional regulator [Dictyobacter alpinus]GCE30553.1 AraC family transcriptional regulator [Dictyobacter alpinus]
MPRSSEVYIWHKEIRFDLPFSLLLENLLYIGVARSESWHVRPHFHDHFEMCYVDKGQGWFTIEDVPYTVKQGDLFLTRPGEVHQGAASGEAEFCLYYVGFQLARLSTLELEYYQLGIQRVAPDPSQQIKALFDQIFFDELQQRQSHALEMVQSLFLQLLVSLLRIYAQATRQENKPPVPLSPVLRQALYYLHSDPGGYTTIDALALQFHMSRSHLAREFKHAMGISLGYYMRSIALEWAKIYLKETPDTVSVIAERLHFSSIHTFSMFFKRHTNMSPQEYRKSLLHSDSYRQDDH